MDEIRFRKLSGPYGFLSNFYPAPFVKNGTRYKTSEHFYQSHKAFYEQDKINIIKALTPKEAATIGRSIKIIEFWDRQKNDIMLEALLLKFAQNEGIRERLIFTGEAKIVEDSPWDSYWGCGSNGRGINKLGELLMTVRYLMFLNFGGL